MTGWVAYFFALKPAYLTLVLPPLVVVILVDETWIEHLPILIVGAVWGLVFAPWFAHCTAVRIAWQGYGFWAAIAAIRSDAIMILASLPIVRRWVVRPERGARAFPSGDGSGGPRR